MSEVILSTRRKRSESCRAWLWPNPTGTHAKNSQKPQKSTCILSKQKTYS